MQPGRGVLIYYYAVVVYYGSITRDHSQHVLILHHKYHPRKIEIGWNCRDSEVDVPVHARILCVGVGVFFVVFCFCFVFCMRFMCFGH